MAGATTANGTATQGWTSSPNDRGTYDIFMPCVITIFLCCWTSVYPNIAGPLDGRWARFRDKLGLALMGILGPEFLLALAMGQRSSARRSLKKYHAEGFRDWTLSHSFFADMGGFVLQAPGLARPVPIDAGQLLYLVQHGYLAYPTLSKAELDDRDKSDGLTRLLSIFQATWFFVNLVARAVQHLDITTLELTTVSFIIVLFATAWCWKDKPADVQTTILLQTPVSMDEILAKAKGPSHPSDPTPLSFISRTADVLQVMWTFYNTLLLRLLPIRNSPFARRIRAKPWDRTPSDLFHAFDFGIELVGWLFIVSYGATFSLAWNWYFETDLERKLWRIASAYMLIYTSVGAADVALWSWILLPVSRALVGRYKGSLAEGEMHMKPVQHLYNWAIGNRTRAPTLVSCCMARKSLKAGELLPSHSSETEVETEKGPRKRKRGLSDWALMPFTKTYNVSPDDDPHLDVPLGMMITNTTLCAVYIPLRLYILLEDIVALRSLPASAFTEVNWTGFLPHI